MAQKSDTGIEVFFIRYRKLLTVMCIILLVGFPFELYEFFGVDNHNTGEIIGKCIDTIIYLFVLIYMARNIRKAYKSVNADGINDD